MIIDLSSPHATLENAGGKGANLAHLRRAGFDVPPGFIVSTDGYREFVRANRLEEVISTSLAGLTAGNGAGLEEASLRIRQAFSAGNLPGETAVQLREAYARLGARSGDGNGPAVAVRSSATAEDLPELSFAGQQDTYLNVLDDAQVLAAVVKCWGSLWTARAIGYRLRNDISQQEVALAVVIQEMVHSDVSGVLFTANPLTGRLDEMVIDATFGLGEALVSGQVEPDHFVVEASSGTIISKKLGSKHLSIRGAASGGIEVSSESAAGMQTLSQEEIRRLTEAGRGIQAQFDAPQDIEWAFSSGKLFILQSRPITSLFPVPRQSFDPLEAWISFGAVQGVVGPFTPLGQDGIMSVAAGSGKLFGATVSYNEQDAFVTAGERMWIKVSDMIRNPVGMRVLGALDFIDPSMRQILRDLSAEPRFGAGSGRLKPGTLWKLARFFLPIMFKLARNMLFPDGARQRFDESISGFLRSARIAPGDDRFGRLANTLAFIKEHVAIALPYLLPRFIPVFGVSMGTLNLLTHLSGDPTLALEVTRSLPQNVTVEMDLELWETAKVIHADGEAAAALVEIPAQELSRRYLEGSLPPAAQTALAAFMDEYGMRGVGEIDLGRTRWREDPTPVMHTLKSYLQIDPQLAPDVQLARGEQAAQRAVEQIAARVRNTPGGWLKERLARGAARRIRLTMGVRESPKFAAVRTMGIARRALLEAGKEFVEAGDIERPDDLVFLRLVELEALSRRDELTPDLKGLVAERRLTYARELRRRQVPRVLVSDGRAFYEGVGAATDTEADISGSPVSPGVVEGVVRVVLDPHGVQLMPGEILVCPGTDPAWTPLFIAAGGLVTEVGGMMTHGSVVAREYGIPAVVGVHQATTRLKDGQRIRLDGTRGRITVIEPGSPE